MKNQTKSNNKIIAIDFDGVIHKYSKGWQDGSIYDEPIEKSLYALQKLYRRGYNIVIFTARENTEEVRAWIVRKSHQYAETLIDPIGDFLEDLQITNQKPRAIAYIDDRGIRFTDWKDMLNYF